jgi:XapX domain-containing protein
MKILIAFIVAFGIGAGSRWTGVPSLAPQAIVGALLIVAMSTGYVSADRFLKRTPPVSSVTVSTGAWNEKGPLVPARGSLGPRWIVQMILARGPGSNRQ